MLAAIIFYLTTALGVFIVMRAIGIAFEGNARRVAWLALGIWLGVTGALAHMDVLTPSGKGPPPVPLMATAAIIAGCVLALAVPGRRLAQRVSPAWVVAFQAFRVPVEMFLWLATAGGLAPPLMSFGPPEGRNFDALAGLLGLTLGGFMLARRKVLPRWALLAFHLAGLALVMNVVVHAVLATPGPLQRIEGQVPWFVATFPYVWLPALLVPLAVSGHVLGLRQVALLGGSKTGPDGVVRARA